MIGATREMVYARFNHNIVPGPIAIRSVLAIPGDTRIDQARIQLRNRSVIHAILLERAGQIVLDEDVAGFG